jgi:aspartate 1-decarboxylase
VGSITLDPVLMAAAGILEHEKVLVANITNCSRLETYAVAGDGRPGEVCINGAAANQVSVGDLVLIMTFRIVEEAEGSKYPPAVVFVDENNAVTSISKDEP